MTIPFLNLPILNLIRLKLRRQPVEASAPIPAPVAEKPSSERLSKTVLPSAARAVSLQDPFRVGAKPNPVANGDEAFAGGAPIVSFGSPALGLQTPDLPPALAFALEPKVERVISLELCDIVPEMPPGWVKELNEDDASRRVLLKAAELEKGMGRGKPSVSISTIYRQVPEIFLRPVDASDSAQVRLPFGKVLEQFTKLQLRGDQFRDQSVPQFSTPFLKVTLEDNERFGTTTEALETDDLPPVRVQPATADSIAAAEPEPAAQEKVLAPNAHFPIQFPVQTEMNGNGSDFPFPPVEPGPAAAPTRIPFKLPPGTDAPASESVPASNGASVPTSVPVPLVPARIPFKVSAPSEDARPKGESWLTKENYEIQSKAATVEEETPGADGGTNAHVKPVELTISLPLKPILAALPPFQLTAEISGVPDDSRIELPFSLVEPQLASGRVSIDPNDFAAALPENYRALFTSKDIATPVSLPLQEVLKNLPLASLQMRDDQEEQEIGADFATPFSAKAEEDAKRFNLPSAPVTRPRIEPPVSAVETSEPAAMLTVPKPAKTAQPETEEGTVAEERFDAKGVVARVSAMPGVRACAIMFGDGLSLAGNIPEELHADGLCALAPSILQRIENHVAETQLGALRAMRLCCAQAAITFVLHGDLCLAALHAGGELPPETGDQLGRIVQELSRKYSNPV